MSQLPVRQGDSASMPGNLHAVVSSQWHLRASKVWLPVEGYHTASGDVNAVLPEPTGTSASVRAPFSVLIARESR